VAGDLGQNMPGQTLTVNGSLGSLKIGGNLNANVLVQKNLGTLLVGGSILSGRSVSVGQTINLLKVGGDVQAGSLVEAHKIKKKLVKGQILGTIMG
jgi:hypothetical protein